jgi:thiamine biosynthesis lipoprotein
LGTLKTSGARFLEVPHILNPQTGMPVQGMQSVSVHATDCLTAGCLSTIAMLKGHDGIAWLAQLGVDYVVVDASGQQHVRLPN